MRDAEAFKVGFCKYMAEQGLLPSDFEAALDKTAADGLSISSLVPSLATLGLAKNVGLEVGLGVPLLLGAGAGYIGRRAMQAEEPTLDDVKGDEMTSLYRQLARDVRERTAMQQQRKPKKPRTIA